MNELQKLYDVLVRDGYYTKSFDEFTTQFQTPEYQDKVFNVVSRDGLFTKSKDEFLQKYTIQQPIEPVKKKEDTVLSGEDASLESPSKIEPTESIAYSPFGFPSGLQRTKEYKAPEEFEGKGLGYITGELLKTAGKGVAKFVPDVLETAAIVTAGANNLIAETGLIEKTKATDVTLPIGLANVNLYGAAKAYKDLLDEYVPTDKEIESGFWGQTATAVGQMIPVILTGLVSGGAKAVTAEAARRGTSKLAPVVNALDDMATRIKAPEGILTFSQVTAPSYQQAIEEGATEDEALAYATQNAVVSFPLEMLPVNRLFKRLDESFTGNQFVNVIKKGFVGGSEEFMTEGFQNLYENLSANMIYDANKNIFDGIGDAASVGGMVGFLMNASLTALLGKRATLTNPDEIQTIDIAIEELESKINSVNQNNENLINTVQELKDNEPISLKNGDSQIGFIKKPDGTIEMADNAVNSEQATSIVDYLSKTYSKIQFTAEPIESDDPYSPTQFKIIGKPINVKQDAVQEQATSQVPLQPEARGGQEMAQGEPQAEPQVITQEGVQEEVVSSKTPEFSQEEVDALEAKLLEEAVDEDAEPQFQLETAIDTEGRKTELVSSARKLMDSVSEQLEQQPSVVEAPTVTPIPINVTENTELANKVPKMSLRELVGKKINLVMADQLKVGDGLMGGNFFPLIDKLFGKAAWASIDLPSARKIVKGAINGDYSVVYNMAPTAVDSNSAFMDTLIKRLQQSGSKETTLAELKDYVKGKKFGKKTDQVISMVESSATLDELADKMNSLDVETMSNFVRKILPSKNVKAATQIGVLLQSQGITQESIREEISEQFARDLPMGAMTMVLKITDKDGNPVTEKNIDDAIITQQQQDAEGLPKHKNYPIYIRGKAVAMLSETVPFWNMNKNALDTINAKVAGVIRGKEGGAYTSSQARAAEVRRASMKASSKFKATKPNKTQYEQFVERLSKAIPSVEVVTSQDAFNKLLNDLNAKKLATKNQKIYGAVLNGKLYLNPNLENFNTPIHEFGHIWTNTVKELSPEIYQKGIELITGSDYVAQIESNPEYKRITDQMKKNGATDQQIREYVLEEALATAIGDKGESFATAAQQRSFKTWLNDLFQFVKNLTGISKMSAEQIQNLTLDEFLNGVVTDLLSENEIFKNAEVKNLSSQLQLMTGGAMSASRIVKTGRANGFSEVAIRTVLSNRGFSEAEIDAALTQETGAASRVEVTEEFAKGYDRVKGEIEGIIQKSLNRGRSEAEAMQNAIDYLQKSKVYENATDVQREKMVRDIRKSFGKREKSAPSAGRVTGAAAPTMVTVDQMKALKDQLRLEAKAARDAKGDIRAKRNRLAEVINGMATAGTLTAKKVEVMLRKINALNVDSIQAVEKFIDYASKVFADAEYGAKLSEANSTRKKIKRLSKNKDKAANLRDLGSKFADIDPSMVDDIDLYNEIASKIAESIEGSKIRTDDVKFANIIREMDVSQYINETLKAQKEEMFRRKKEEIEELLGIDLSDTDYDKILELIEDAEPNTKYNESTIRGKINRAFDIYSSIINGMLDTGNDQVTGEKLDISLGKQKVIRKFMDMDLNILSPKDALAAVDALVNFMQNGSTAKMEAVVSSYTGEVNARRLVSDGVKASPLKKYWSKQVGRFLAEQTTNLNILFERMFKGFKRGGKVESLSGVADLKNGKSKAQSIANRIVNDYVNKYYKLRANGEAFNTAYNSIERGLTSFMMRTVNGTDAQVKAEFQRRKNLILQSIEALSKGNSKEVEKAKLYQDAYDNILQDAESIEDVVANADAVNLSAVRWWQEQWADKYEELSDVSENVYNKSLGNDINYTPDKFSRLSSDTGKVEIANDDMAFHGNNGAIYKKETGVLMETTKPKKLPNKRFIDLSFDKNNANSMYDALVDLNTAGAIRQIEGFLNSDSFEKIVPQSEDAKIMKDRINLFVRNIRNKNPFEHDELSKVVRRLNKLASIGAGQALGGVLQPLKQVIPVAMNTIINTNGNLDIASTFDQAKQNFINRSGYAIANRGIESQAQVDSLNKLLKEAENSTGEKLLSIIEKGNNLWLKGFLVKPDVFIARASWMSYYEQSLIEQGIDPKTIDYNTHEVNDEAANYAQRMVDRQQNVSDADLAGKFFTGDQSAKTILTRMFLPFASFRMNQSARLGSDLATLMSNDSTKEDKAIALRSVFGFTTEMATFRMISTGAALLIGAIVKQIMGREDDEEKEQKRTDAIIKGQMTGTIADIFSPIPIADQAIQMGFAYALDKVQSAADIAEDERVSIYSGKKQDFFESLGMFGISGSKAKQTLELIDLSVGKKYTDDFGRVKNISDNDAEALSMLIAPSLLLNIGLAPSEVGSVVRNAVSDAKRNSSTKSPDKKDEMSKTDMKRYYPERYEQLYGKGSVNYEAEQEKKKAEKEKEELQQKLKDERYGYQEKPKSGFGSKGFGSKGFGSK